MTALWRYKDTESVVRAMDGYTPGEGWVLYAPAQPAPAWHDAPTVPGIWLFDESNICYEWTAHSIEILDVRSEDGVRWFGPIPEDQD